MTEQENGMCSRCQKSDVETPVEEMLTNINQEVMDYRVKHGVGLVFAQRAVEKAVLVKAIGTLSEDRSCIEDIKTILSAIVERT
jgi:hypothetical protein